jgi:hypothetical protein
MCDGSKYVIGGVGAGAYGLLRDKTDRELRYAHFDLTGYKTITFYDPNGNCEHVDEAHINLEKTISINVMDENKRRNEEAEKYI